MFSTVRNAAVVRALLVLVIGLAGSRSLVPLVLADTPTPVVATAVSTPIPTPLPATAIPTPAPEATGYPTAEQEQSTPVVTVPPTSAPSPTSIPTNTPVPEVVRPAHTPAPVTVVTPTPAALPTVAPPSGGGILPTAAQLRAGALLRWGDRVPDSVRRWAFLIVPIAKRYGVDPNLVAAVVTMESNGDPLALSPADARGLMQVLHGPWDPRTNIETGIRMLADLYSEFGSWPLALAAYNAGPAAVEAYNGVPPYRETQDYVVIVQYLWDLYGHHQLTVARKKQFSRSLSDLRHFADQRKKIVHLAHAAHLPVIPLDPCAPRACSTPAVAPPPPVLDPFWPDSSSPDPLQRIDPLSGPHAAPTPPS